MYVSSIGAPYALSLSAYFSCFLIWTPYGGSSLLYGLVDG